MTPSSERSSRRLRILAVAVTAALALLAAACGDSTDLSTGDDAGTTTSDETHTTEPAMVHLPPGTYRSESITGRELVEGSTITLHFEDQQLSANAGCNTMAGEYALEGDVLVLPFDMRSTLMGCEEPLMDQDSWLSTFLSERPRWKLEGTQLTLSTDEVTLTFAQEVEEPDPGPTGVLGSWELDTIIDGDTASTVPADVQTPTLEVTETEVAVFAGCNRGGASLTLGDDVITVGPLRLTRMACGEAAMQVESRVSALFGGELPYQLDGDRLTLGPPEQALIWRRA